MIMTKIFTLCLVTLLFLAFAAHGQCTCSGRILLSSQTEVDAFCCTEVAGSLTISGPDITNLNALSIIKKIVSDAPEGDVFSFGLRIADNPLLTNIDGFTSLTEMEGPIEIVNNPALERINGFMQLIDLHGSVEIIGNNSLKSINGFKGITFIDSFYFFSSLLHIGANPLLTSINGFSSLTLITGRYASLQISDNQSLVSMNGLKSLTVFDGGSGGAGLSIQNNPQLKNLNGLSGLVRFGWGPSGGINISNNASLENVDGLSSLMDASGPAGALRITVTHNPMLTRCCGLFSLLNSIDPLDISYPPFIDISANGAGCTADDILRSGPCADACHCSGKIVLRSQEAVNNFHCTEIEGSLSISGPDIVNLASLSSIKSIKPKVVADLYTFAGLSFQFNPQLTTLDGFTSLKQMDGRIDISANDALKSITAFPELKTTSRGIFIEYNNSLEAINGFKKLTEISSGTLSIAFNPVLKGFDGFSSLKTVRGTVSINANQLLPTVEGLRSLALLEGLPGQPSGVSITANSTLKNIDGLRSLTLLSWTVNGNISVQDNTVLENVDGLSALTHLDGPPSQLIIEVNRNPALTRCCGLYPLLNSLDADASSQAYIDISTNGAGCTREDILNGGTCAPPTARISIAISPVPTAGELTMHIDGDNETSLQVVIMNMNGQVFYKALHDLRTSNTINTTSLQTGLYYFIVSDNKGFTKSIEFLKK
jgi:hypothetical protein